MADGVVGAIKQGAADIHEAVIKPTGEQLGKAIEEGVQTAVGSQPKPLDPVAQQKKQEEEIKKKNWAHKVIDWYKKIQESQQAVRNQKKQEDQVKKQQEEEEKQKKKVQQYKVMEQKKTEVDLGVKQAQTKTEVRGGVGG